MKALGLAVRKRFWDGRAVGERRLIVLVASILLPLLGFFLLWQPAHNAVARLRVRVPAMRMQAALLRDQTAEVARLNHYPHPALLDGKALKSVIETTAEQHHIREAITALDAQGSGAVRVTLDSVPFDQWLLWLRDLQQEQHVRVDSVGIAALAQSGMVRVNSPQADQRGRAVAAMRILAVGFFALVYLVALLIMAPASLFDELVRHYSQGRLVIANANGTMWKGTAVPGLRTRDGHLIATRTLRWDIDFLPLLKGVLRARLQWNDSAPAAATELLVSGGQVELNHALIPLPAALLNEVSPILKPAEFRGQLKIQSNHLVLSRRGMEGIAIVDWQHAGSALSSIDPLGNYRLTLNGAGNVVSVDLSTTSGILVLEGQGKWSGSSGLEFRGKARASSGNEERLNELLHNLGPELSPGVATFNLTPGQ